MVPKSMIDFDQLETELGRNMSDETREEGVQMLLMNLGSSAASHPDRFAFSMLGFGGAMYVDCRGQLIASSQIFRSGCTNLSRRSIKSS